MMKLTKPFARKQTRTNWKPGAVSLLVLMVSLLSTSSAQACGLFDRLFHRGCWSPCLSHCGPAVDPCCGSTLPYTPAYSYRPMAQPIWPGFGCQTGSPMIYPGGWQSYQPGTGALPATNSMSFSTSSYSTSSFPSSGDWTTGSTSSFSPVSTSTPYTVSQHSGEDYSEWTSVPATGSNATLEGVIVEQDDYNATGYPANPIREPQVPTPRDQTSYERQSHNDSSSPYERAAKAKAFRERFASRRNSKLYRRAQTHTYGGGVQYDHRQSVKAPTAAIVWQTP